MTSYGVRTPTAEEAGIHWICICTRTGYPLGVDVPCRSGFAGNHQSIQEDIFVDLPRPQAFKRQPGTSFECKQDTPDSMASFVRVLLALWALFMLTAVAQASAGRTLLQPGAVLPCDSSTSNAGNVCPKDGTFYTFCMHGPATGGCRPSSEGVFPASSCKQQCFFRSD